MMINYFQAVVMGLLQGISELFPISSLGHSVILPGLLGWQINQDDPLFLTFLVATHLATALVLLGFFWKDWLEILKGLWRSVIKMKIEPHDSYARLAWLLIIGTVPAGLLGLIFQKKLEVLFAAPMFVAIFLALNGIMLFGAEILRRNAAEKSDESGSDQRVARLGWGKAFMVGLAQIIALIPGFSRSGSTMAGGLLVGLSHEDSVRFSFLLATPIIGAAALLKLPELFKSSSHQILGPALVGAICAAAAAWFAVKFLVRYFKTNKLTPFAVYCVLAGVLAFLFLH